MDRVAGAAAALRLLARGLLQRRPAPVSTEQRLAMLAVHDAPLAAPVSIRWDTHQIPFVEADSDEDLAVALGIVHAHLRLTQIELIRRVAFGRIAEMIGAFGIELDRTLLLMDVGRAVPGIIASLHEDTRRFAEAFVRGINHQLFHGTLPPEFHLLGLQREAWTLTDLLTMGRIAAADVTWFVFSRLLRARRRLGPQEWRTIWPRLLDDAAPAGWPPDPATATEQVLASPTRSGSNSAAVGASRSASGAAMIASDPHLTVRLPNLWLIAGMRAPGLHAVGLMLAGFPFVALGRNPWIAWGGTNLHAASSELFDVSGLAADAFREREAVLRVRWGRPRRLRLRETSLGPVVSDGAMLGDGRPLALRWVGHHPSDEIGAMLGVNRARDWDGFSQALAGFAVPGQTMVYAGTDGRVGRLTAAHLPRRATGNPADLVLPPTEAWNLDDLADTTGLPRQFDPARGFVVSANERPPGTFPVGHFFSSGARAARMADLLGIAGRVSSAELALMQRDVQQPRALALRDFLLALVPPRPNRRALAALAAWDGAYHSTSRGALVYEIVLAHLARSMRRRQLAPYQALWSAQTRIARDIMATAPAILTPWIGEALTRAARGLRAYGDWGGMHRLRLVHHLALLPLLGRRYGYGDFPAEGGNETLHKTGHALTSTRHNVSFGSCARHISDLADPDANRFVLLGGQDGWPGSANYLDQVPLWREGGYVSVPLRPETARRFPHLTVLRPPA